MWSVLVPIVQAIEIAVIFTLLDGTLVHHRCLPNNVAAHFQPSILGHIGANGIA